MKESKKLVLSEVEWSKRKNAKQHQLIFLLQVE
jgi:hypothetical protein